MTKTALSKSLRRLPVTDRMELVDELMVSIAADQSKIPVTASQKVMIDECLDEIERHPGRGMTLLQFRKKLKDAYAQMAPAKRRKTT